MRIDCGLSTHTREPVSFVTFELSIGLQVGCVRRRGKASTMRPQQGQRTVTDLLVANSSRLNRSWYLAKA